MKPTTEELLLAAEVRKIVVLKIMNLTADMTPDEEKEFRKKPQIDLIESVVADLTNIAGVIAKHRQASTD